MSDAAGPGTRRWSVGETITLRYTGHWSGRQRDRPGILEGWPYVVARDDELLALWMPVGSLMARVDLADRSRTLPPLVHGGHPVDAFRRGDVLRLMWPGRGSSIWLHWDPAARLAAGREHAAAFLGWYVNLEAPFLRTAIGVDTTDDSLDINVAPDRSWRWKDEHLIEHWVDLGVYTPAEMRAIRARGERVIEDVEAARPPFDGSWLDWTPGPGWPVPSVTPGWDRVPGYERTLSTSRNPPGVERV